MPHAARKALRTALQVVVSGALTGLVTALADLSPEWRPVILAGWLVVVTWGQNALEARGAVPTLLPSPPTRGAGAPLLAKTEAGVAQGGAG
ncbi:MAG: hypothetical protein ACRD2W_20835 [Acidimicrobiales bacterium]